MSTPLACTPSALLAANPVVQSLAESDLVAELVYALSQETDYALPDNLTRLLQDSACFRSPCLSDKQKLMALVNLFANRFLADPLAPSTVLAQVKCLRCHPMDTLEAALLFLICQTFMNSFILESGVVQLAGGTATVASAFANAANPILLSYFSSTTTGSTLSYNNIVAGISFRINSGDLGDTNYVSWAILRPS